MPLREPNIYVVGVDYQSKEVLDIRDAVNEWIAENEKIHADAYKMVGEAVGQITQRLDLLEDLVLRHGLSENIKPVVSSPPVRKKKKVKK